MTETVRMSGPTLKLLKLLIERPERSYSGAEISKEAKIGSGTLYPLLQRLEHAGWLVSAWEGIDPSEAGRPRRRFYALTPQGRRGAFRELTTLQLKGEETLACI